MDYFENFMEEVGKFLEKADTLLGEMAKEQEPEKKGVSWDELSDWVAESEGVQEFEEDSDAEQPVYVTKEADLHATCENCEQCVDCGECGCDEYLNHDSYDEDSDEYWEWIEEEREKDDEWDASERISLLDYREGLFRHLRKQNPNHGNDKLFLLTNIVSDVVWEIAEGQDTVVFGEDPEDRRAGDISSAHQTIEGSNYLRALIGESLGSISLYMNLSDAEAEIKKYLKEKN